MTADGAGSGSDAIIVDPRGFNLLPYRQRHTLRAKRSLRAQLAGAALAGLALAAGLAGWQTREVGRLEARYAALSQQWGALGPALAADVRRRGRADRTATLARLRAEAAAQRERFERLLRLLSRRARSDLALTELHHRAGGATLRGRSETYHALQAWIGTLERAPLLQRVAIVDLGGPAGPRKPALATGARDGRTSALAFTLRLDYVASRSAGSLLPLP